MYSKCIHILFLYIIFNEKILILYYLYLLICKYNIHYIMLCYLKRIFMLCYLFTNIKYSEYNMAVSMPIWAFNLASGSSPRKIELVKFQTFYKY